jgi:hypothetical protein
LRVSVRLRGIQLGRPVDVVLHPTAPRALGLDVLCGDGRHRFLPFAAASLDQEGFEIETPFVLVDLTADSAYRTEARWLSGLRGSRLAGGRELRDIVLGPQWTIEELIVESEGTTMRVPLDGTVLPAHNPGRRVRWLPGRRRRRSS